MCRAGCSPRVISRRSGRGDCRTTTIGSDSSSQLITGSGGRVRCVKGQSENFLSFVEGLIGVKTVTMEKEKTKRYRKKRMRSYRKLMQILWAFGIALNGLGVVLVLLFGSQHKLKWALLGVVYILLATILFGIRNILAYIDRERKHKRHAYSSPVVD